MKRVITIIALAGTYTCMYAPIETANNEILPVEQPIQELVFKVVNQNPDILNPIQPRPNTPQFEVQLKRILLLLANLPIYDQSGKSLLISFPGTNPKAFLILKPRLVGYLRKNKDQFSPTTYARLIQRTDLYKSTISEPNL